MEFQNSISDVGHNGPRRVKERDVSVSIENDDEIKKEPEFLAWRRFHQSKAKLRGVTEMAALLAGFSIVATVELDIVSYTSTYLLVAFVVTTALLVTTTMFSILIATCILPHLEAASKSDSTFLLKQSPHDAFIMYIDVSWVMANAISIFLFIVDVILLAWIKFQDPIVCMAFTAIMGPVLVLLILFSMIFYRKLLDHQYTESLRRCNEIGNIYMTILSDPGSASLESLNHMPL